MYLYPTSAACLCKSEILAGTSLMTSLVIVTVFPRATSMVFVRHFSTVLVCQASTVLVYHISRGFSPSDLMRPERRRQARTTTASDRTQIRMRWVFIGIGILLMSGL